MLALNDNIGQHGGYLPKVANTVGNSLITMTMVTWSKAAGEAILPYFDFSTTTQRNKTMSVYEDIQPSIPTVKGKLGVEDIRNFQVLFCISTNDKMDDKEFKNMWLEYESLKRLLVVLFALSFCYLQPFGWMDFTSNIAYAIKGIDQIYGLFKYVFNYDLRFLIVTWTESNTIKHPAYIHSWLYFNFLVEHITNRQKLPKMHLKQVSMRSSVWQHDPSPTRLDHFLWVIHTLDQNKSEPIWK